MPIEAVFPKSSLLFGKVTGHHWTIGIKSCFDHREDHLLLGHWWVLKWWEGFFWLNYRFRLDNRLSQRFLIGWIRRQVRVWPDSLRTFLIGRRLRQESLTFLVLLLRQLMLPLFGDLISNFYMIHPFFRASNATHR